MKPTEKRAFLEVLSGVYGFYRQELTTFVCTVWWEAMESFELKQVSKAFSTHLMDPEHGKWLPKPSDVVRALQGTQSDRALIAWGKAMDAAARVGAYASVVFDDPLVHAVIEDLGGWPKFCRCEMAELPFLQSRFCSAYKAYANRGEGLAYPAKLVGESEAANRTKGHETAAPVFVGDPALARHVMTTGSARPKTLITAGDAVPLLERFDPA